MTSVAVTGATGFIGKRLCKTLDSRGLNVTKIVRGSSKHHVSDKSFGGEDNSCNTDWAGLDAGQGCVVHLAARVHVIEEVSSDPQNAYWRSNVDGTLRLARQAAAAGVERFIFVSTVKVNGEVTYGRPFSPKDEPAPGDLYGHSKLEAEKGLREIAAETGLEVVIIRPPLVYGPEVKANFLKLMRLVYRRVPLPFGVVHNKRSFIYLDNLIDFIARCISHPAAAGETFLVSDGADLSTSDLIRKIGSCMHRSPVLLPVPVRLLKRAGGGLGKKTEIERLCGSLQIDISKTKELLGWKPPFSVGQGLAETVSWFIGHA